MPNHVHAIITIDNENRCRRDARPCVPTTAVNHGVAYRAPKSISSFAAGFKSAVTKQINEYRKTPGVPVWQPRFYDHVIRDDTDIERIRNYIETNPRKWQDDLSRALLKTR